MNSLSRQAATKLFRAFSEENLSPVKLVAPVSTLRAMDFDGFLIALGNVANLHFSDSAIFTGLSLKASPVDMMLARVDGGHGAFGDRIASLSGAAEAWVLAVWGGGFVCCHCHCLCHCQCSLPSPPFIHLSNRYVAKTQSKKQEAQWAKGMAWVRSSHEKKVPSISRRMAKAKSKVYETVRVSLFDGESKGSVSSSVSAARASGVVEGQGESAVGRSMPETPPIEAFTFTPNINTSYRLGQLKEDNLFTAEDSFEE